MIFNSTAFLLVHVALSLVGIISGFVVLYGLLTSRRLSGWTAIFLTTTIATSVTGFLFPFVRFLPSHAVGIVSLLILPVTLIARYRRNMEGYWRPTYVITAMIALYLNVFVLVAQSFMKIPALKALAPTQSRVSLCPDAARRPFAYDHSDGPRCDSLPHRARRCFTARPSPHPEINRRKRLAPVPLAFAARALPTPLPCREGAGWIHPGLHRR